MGLLAGRINESEELLSEERSVLATVGAALQFLAEVDCTGFSREQFADHTIELVAVSQMAMAASAGFVAVGEETACALTKGEASMTAALNSGCRISRRTGTQLDLVGSAPGRYPAFYAAVLAGRITAAHIEVVHRVWRRIDRHQFNAAEADLCDLACMCTPEEFGVYLAEWENHADEDAALDRFLEQQAKQHFQYGFDVFGSVHYSGTVGPEHAEPFVETIETEAKNHRSDDNLPSQALGAGLVELVLSPDGKYRAHLEVLVPQHHPPRPTGLGGTEAATDPEDRDECDAVRAVNQARFDLANTRARAMARQTVPDPTDRSFSGVRTPRTARGTLIPPAIAKQMKASGARVREHVVDTDGNIAGDRHTGRHFNTNQKRLIRLRDSRCRQPGCRRTVCEYDHVDPVDDEGLTLITNGQLLCRRHHRFKHRNDPGPNRPTQFDDSPLMQDIDHPKQE